MLKLSGNAAVVMFVAKGGLSDIPEIIHRLQAGIAIMAGLTKRDFVREGDALRIAGDLFDVLCHAGLLTAPAQHMISYFSLIDMYNATAAHDRTKQAEPPLHMLIGTFISAIRGMRIRNDQDGILVSWKEGLPEGFERDAMALYEASMPKPKRAFP